MVRMHRDIRISGQNCEIAKHETIRQASFGFNIVFIYLFQTAVYVSAVYSNSSAVTVSKTAVHSSSKLS